VSAAVLRKIVLSPVTSLTITSPALAMLVPFLALP
jgi:hypothetical protein